MPGPIIKTLDMIMCEADPPCVTPELMIPIPLVGTSPNVLVMGLPICLEGDQLPMEWLAPSPYISPPFVIPGMLTVDEVIAVPEDNLTTSTLNDMPILVQGSPMVVMMSVVEPAMFQPPGPVPPVPDPVPVKTGMATIINENFTVIAS